MTTDPEILALVREGEEAIAAAKKRLSPRREQSLRSILVSTEPVPHAVCIATMVTRCDTCGSTFRYPGKRLILRYGKKYLHTDRSIAAYGGVRRERLEKLDVVPHCEHCWPDQVPTMRFQ
jgi:hypothetical protein